MTQSKPVVGASEAVTLLFVFLTAKSFLSEALFIFDAGYNATWMVALLMTGYALGTVWLLSTLLNRFPGRDLVEIGEVVVGPYLNLVLILYYQFVFVIGAGFVLRGISERMVSGFLPDSPISLVVFFFILGAVVVSYMGVEAVARTARLLVGILVISAGVLILLTIPFWQWHALFPLWGSGPLPVVMGSLAHSGDFVQILLLGIIVPFIPQNMVGSIGIRGTLAAGLVLFVYLAAAVLIFTYPLVTEITLPSMEMAKIINISRFGQRLEVLFLPVWAFGNLIYLSISLYAGAHILARFCKLRDHRPFVPPVAVLTTVAAFGPPNSMLAASWSNASLSQFGLIILVAVLSFLLLVARVRGKGGQGNVQGG